MHKHNLWLHRHTAFKKKGWTTATLNTHVVVAVIYLHPRLSTFGSHPTLINKQEQTQTAISHKSCWLPLTHLEMTACKLKEAKENNFSVFICAIYCGFWMDWINRGNDFFFFFINNSVQQQPIFSCFLLWTELKKRAVLFSLPNPVVRIKHINCRWNSLIEQMKTQL